MDRSTVAETPWQLWIDHTPRPGWANMSIDMGLLDRAEHNGESWLRLYCWDPPCLSFGRHEPATTRYDADRIHALGVDAVRRPTGGRAVWHARELTYAVASPQTRFGSLRGAYLEIHRLLAQALKSLGLTATLAPRTPAAALDTGACFSRPVGGEVLVDGRKVIGSAQLRQGDALLQHGSILLRDDQQWITTVTRGPVPLPTPGASAAQAMSSFRAEEMARAVGTTARLRWSGVGEPITDAGSILAESRRYYPRFRSAAWTWAR